jgi:hypothetical protein
MGLLGLMWLRFHQPRNTVDDAYITFRYARNLATGAGLVYNTGERVLGTTTPAYAMMLALFSRLSNFFDYPRLALLINTMWDALTFCLLARLTARLTGQRWVGAGAALLLAIDGYLLDFSTGGMESSLYVFTIVLTLTLFFDRHTVWAALVAGLVVLVRPDGLILAAVVLGAIGLAWLRGQSAWPGREIAAFAIVVLPWLITATVFYGSPIPQTVRAKDALGQIAPPFTALGPLLIQLRALLPFSLPPVRPGDGMGVEAVRALLPITLCGLGNVLLLRRHPQAWVIGVYLAGFVAAFALGNPYWFPWYQTPLTPLYQLLILAACCAKRPSAISHTCTARKCRCQPSATRHVSLVTRIRPPLAIVAVGLMALPQLSRLNLLPWETPQRPPLVLNTAYVNKDREADYTLLAHMLRPAAESQRVAAIQEIGAFGYAYPGHLFDVSGLVSPRAVDYFHYLHDLPPGTGFVIPRQMLFEVAPDWFINFDSLIALTLPPDDPEFLRRYPPAIGLTSHAIFGQQRLVAYRRADVPIEVALPSEAQPIGVIFGDDWLTLEGYTVRPDTEQGEDFYEAVLFWRNGDAPLVSDILVRVQLLNAEAAPVYEVLYYPGEGLFPTQSWTPGMWLIDRYRLKRPAPDAGPYTLAVALFDNVTGEQIAAHTPAGAALPENTVTLTP